MATDVQELIFYGLSETKVIPNAKTNIFRADLFSLFPNVVEVELWTWNGPYPLNLLSLLSVLEEAVISPPFKRLRIQDGDWHHEMWIKEAFLAIPDVEEQFAAKNFIIKMETIGRGYAKKDWIDIEPLC